MKRKRGRPRKHASNAAKQQAYRDRMMDAKMQALQEFWGKEFARPRSAWVTRVERFLEAKRAEEALKASRTKAKVQRLFSIREAELVIRRVRGKGRAHFARFGWAPFWEEFQKYLKHVAPTKARELTRRFNKAIRRLEEDFS